MESIIYVLLTFATIFFSVWVDYVFYNWFILPIIKFPLTYAQVFGAGVFWSIFNIKHRYIEKDDDRSMEERIKGKIKVANFYLITLGIGYIVKQIIG